MKLIVIVGPTRTGKTELALALAQKFNGEIVSCDSRQVYLGMDIGTGKSQEGKVIKEKGRWIAGDIPIYLYDVVAPNEEFSVALYDLLARKILQDILNRGKLPILVGGTGFYIKAILDGIETLQIHPDRKLRLQLENLSAVELFQKLGDINPEKAKNLNASDRKNPRRLIRAIEIALSKKTIEKPVGLLNIEFLLIGLKADPQILYQKADEWVEERLRQGLIEEVKKLLAKGYKNAVPMQGMIYKPTREFIGGEMTQEELKGKLKTQMHGFIRRQLTWFKKDKRIFWFDIANDDYQKKMENLVRTWLNGGEYHDKRIA